MKYKTPDEALARLVTGNQNFVKVTENGGDFFSVAKPAEHAREQKPFAIVIGCSDSRVPTELVFQCGLGDLFVIRVAGNIVAPSQVGSVEFACQKFGTQLVTVLGHTNCGAIHATVDALADESASISPSPNIAAIVDRVIPAVRPIINDNNVSDHGDLVRQATRANIEQSVNKLQQKSQVLRDLIENKQLKIVGAEYSLETGVVDFFLND